MTRRLLTYCLTLCWLGALAAPAGADIPDLPQVTANGGTRSYSTNYTYVATTGIAIASNPIQDAPSLDFPWPSSANYDMESGYWYRALSPVLPDCDLTFDDRANGLDIEPFMALALAGIAGDPFLIVHADFDFDGMIDLANDLPKFIERLLYGLLPSAANTPIPVPGSSGAGPNSVVLDWVAGERASSFDVYFGYDEATVRDATRKPPSPQYYGNTTSTEWPLHPLPPNFTVYWRIDSIGVAGISKGIVWSFSTGP